MKKKYGLFTAISMIIGIVIGSGVFFRAEKVIMLTRGNLITGVLAWVIGGAVMVTCSYVFAQMATQYEKVNGIIDYADGLVGEGYAYYFGRFMATVYYPALTSVLAWVSARYTSVLLGIDIKGVQAMLLTFLYLTASYVLNLLSPKISGKIQVSTTVIKLVPLFAMAVLGIIFGARNGVLKDSIFMIGENGEVGTGELFEAVISAVFAYDGWIVATCINSELKDAKKNLPRALMFGSIFVVVIYISYYIGLSGALPSNVFMENEEQSVKLAFSNIFNSNIAGSAVIVFVVISCLGSLNGLMVGATRGFYSIAVRGKGKINETLSTVNKYTDMPDNSAALGLLFSMLWLIYFYGAQLSSKNWFGVFSFDSAELPVISLYAMYIPIFIMFMIKGKEFGILNRFIMPSFAVLAAVFMVICAGVAHSRELVAYLIVYSIIQIIASFVLRKNAL